MKKYLLLVVFILVSISLFSQEKEKKFTIQTNPALILFDLFSSSFSEDDYTMLSMDLEAQYKINNSVNLSLDLLFLLYRDTSYGEKFFQISAKPMFIWRPFRTGLSGFFVGFYPDIGIISFENKEENGLLTEIGFGFSIGYKWVFDKGFTLQLGSKFGRSFILPEEPDNFDFYADTKIIFRILALDLIEFKIGYSF